MLTTKKTALAAIMASLMLSACGGSSGGSNDDVNDGSGDSNSVPTGISLDSSTVAENAAGAEIGTLTATDDDADDSHTFTVDDERFSVSGDTLKLAEGQSLNYEQNSSVTVTVTATDSADASTTEELTIEVEDVLDTYSFESGFTNESSVSYSGQVARYVLLTDIKDLMDTEFGSVEDFNNAGFADRQDALDTLLQYFNSFSDDEYDQLWGATDIRISTDPAKEQQTLLDISGSNKNLVGKLAGNDTTGQHKDWSTEFVGWGNVGSTTPEALVRSWFNEMADNADAQLSGAMRLDPFGSEITKVYLTDDGRNLSQLIHKFLLMGVAYSQAADDYLDGDTEGKGLLTDNTSEDDGAPFTSLEHQFDEGFGYFGAARNFLDYSDDDIASPGYMDTDGSDSIDLESEFNFTFAGYAAKRDLGSQDGAKTDFTKTIFEAFLQGRKIINDNVGTDLTSDQMDELKGYRDTILAQWEKVVAANVIHYANSTLEDYASINTEEFDYGALATHWSEMKAFALGLQFNRLKAIDDAELASLHSLIGDKPVLEGDIDAYLDDIAQAKIILRDAYGFDQSNVEAW